MSLNVGNVWKSVALQSGLQFWELSKVARGQIRRIWWVVQFH
jgi:hypothetical protein